MPVYEYVCPDCNAKFERVRPMSESGPLLSAKPSPSRVN